MHRHPATQARRTPLAALFLLLGGLLLVAPPHGPAAFGADTPTPVRGVPEPPPASLSDDAFLDTLQQAGFAYFWLEANPANGLVRDRSTSNSKCSIAAVGFGLSAIPIAIDHRWITRAEGRSRVLTTLRTFSRLPQGDQPDGVAGHRGWFYHFLEMDTGLRAWKCELSSIDTALLLAGSRDAARFFDQDHPEEREIRSLANLLLDRVDWPWMLNQGDAFSMGWDPAKGFIERRWTGYNEGMILYLLALGARRNPVPERCWTAWTRTYDWRTNYGQAYIEFPPLFGHQYSHCWVDFRGIADDYGRAKGLTYFENSRRATLAARAYAIANPSNHPGYGPLVWGITACDGPGGKGFHTYAGRGAPPGLFDDGTIAPTAAGGSLPFAPEICLPTLRHFHASWREKLWTRYGFRDAFNLKADWFDPDVLGIDQGPVVLMIENHRTGAVWRRMAADPVLQTGLKRAGFRAFPER